MNAEQIRTKKCWSVSYPVDITIEIEKVAQLAELNETLNKMVQQQAQIIELLTNRQADVFNSIKNRLGV